MKLFIGISSDFLAFEGILERFKFQRMQNEDQKLVDSNCLNIGFSTSYNFRVCALKADKYKGRFTMILL